jgi:hypothetical protein
MWEEVEGRGEDLVRSDGWYFGSEAPHRQLKHRVHVESVNSVS